LSETARDWLEDDDAFDDALPAWLRFKSSMHFTPIEVARCAVALLAPRPGQVFLDVGAGAGKFCLVAGQAAPGAEFVGVEWRPHLVEIAIGLAAACRLRNVRFVHADALTIDWAPFDGFYFYNPFAEQLYDNPFRIDRTIQAEPAHFDGYVAGVRARLAQARLGARVVTYHGYGGDPPDGYDLVREERSGSDRISLWVKARPTRRT
jgi:SAM-dependent methyltransferase